MLKYKQGRMPVFIFLAVTAAFLAGCQMLQPARGLERPNGVAVAADGSLFVMDFGNYRIVHLSAEGEILNTIGRFGQKQNDIFYGWDLATGPDGNLYMGSSIRDNAGTRHDGIKVFSPDGEYLREVGGKDYDYNEIDEANLPYGIDVDSSGRIYAANYGTDNVRIFDSEGNLLIVLSGRNQEAYSFINPGDVAFDDSRGLMYVTDFSRGKLLQFRVSFEDPGATVIEYVQTIATYGRDTGQVAFPQYLAVDDSSGIVYVGDMANRRVQGFDSEGAFVASYTPEGVADWQVMGLSAASPEQLVATDAVNNLLWVFNTQAGGAPAVRIEVQP